MVPRLGFKYWVEVELSEKTLVKRCREQSLAKNDRNNIAEPNLAQIIINASKSAHNNHGYPC